MDLPEVGAAPKEQDILRSAVSARTHSSAMQGANSPVLGCVLLESEPAHALLLSSLNKKNVFSHALVLLVARNLAVCSCVLCSCVWRRALLPARPVCILAAALLNRPFYNIISIMFVGSVLFQVAALTARHPAFFKKSASCKRPHLFADKLRDDLFKAKVRAVVYMRLHRVTV